MQAIDLVGFAAGLFVLLTFYCTRAVPLRCCAVVSNLLFLGYGAVTGLAPIAILHAVLLPLNAVRLGQALGTGRLARRLCAGTRAEFHFPSQNPPCGSRFWC